MTLARRRFLQTAGAIVAAPALPRGAAALDYPVKPVRWILGYAPGGTTDILARLVGAWLSERLGQQFIIETRPGAGTNIGTEAVVNAAPDGYTLLMASSSNAINATLYEKLNFNFSRDIWPVAGIARVPLVMEVHPSVPAKTVPEFIAYAKANPGKLAMASSGVGTPPHIGGEYFKMTAGVDMVHVPYRGSGPAVTDMIGGQVQVMFDTTVASIEQIRAGKLRPLAVTSRDAPRGAAGRAGDERILARLRSQRLVRHRGAEKHADGDHRKTQPRGQCGPRAAAARGADRRHGRNGAVRFAGRLRQADRR